MHAFWAIPFLGIVVKEIRDVGKYSGSNMFTVAVLIIVKVKGILAFNKELREIMEKHRMEILCHHFIIFFNYYF